ncbi:MULTISPECIES: hypothetical protein [Trichocoleus]|uniref:Uncharacterized protein n=1 Tax=Trichocoleus desertorum GB2-A4 TaxID=2933944 RepID=A0ABV0JES6_9CYAN|nr:hypothetical protein [Trichocoleus sp. FACHB-46]MBD1864235.1 hypothetical protein [Trichocoleus sp. FACHB-46]
MARDPIKPTEPTPPQPASTAQPSTAPATPASTAKPAAKPTLGSKIPQINQKPSPLKEQHRDTRGQPDYTPVQIIILNGAYKGKSLDLGLAINEVMHSETAEWESQDGDGIRVGINFKRLSPRDISLTLTYCSVVEDVSHLVENLKHLKEITEGESRPPLLLFTQGSIQATECVCTSIQDKYSEPHPKRKGLRRADVDIKLLVGGGKSSSYALGGPLTSTPLGDERARATEAERQKKGLQNVVKTLFAPCVGSEGSADLEKLIEQNKLSDPAEIAKLNAPTFVQAAIAGMFSPSLLQDPKLQTKLAGDLAVEMAVNQDGVGRTTLARKFAEGLLTGILPGSNQQPTLQQQLDLTKPDYDLLLQAIQTQSLDEQSPLFDRTKYPTASERLTQFGACGLNLRRVGAPEANIKNEPEVLLRVNKFWVTKSHRMKRSGSGLDCKRMPR